MDNNKRLWEYEHSYYMSEGNFYSNDSTYEFDDWEDFLSEWGEDTDIDYNRIHRWDFHLDEDTGERTLEIYYVLQRKAILLSCHVTIQEKDEEAIREFLKPHGEYNRKLWEGIS